MEKERLKFKLEEIKWYLDQIYGYASTSKGAQEDINAISEIIESIEGE